MNDAESSDAMDWFANLSPIGEAAITAIPGIFKNVPSDTYQRHLFNV